MESVYGLLLSALTAILLAFLVAKLVSLAVSGVDVSSVDNGDDHKGTTVGVEEGNLEKRLELEGLKRKKKKVKKIPSVSAKILGGLSKSDDFVDDFDKLGSVVKDIGVKEEDDYFRLDRMVKNEGLITSYGKSLNEGLDQDTNQGNDLENLNAYTEMRDYTEGEHQRDDTNTHEVQDEHQRDDTNTHEVQDEHQRDDTNTPEVQDEHKRVLESVKMEISDGEEWEGIENNELERDFVRAVFYVEFLEKEVGSIKLGNDVIMQFHGLQKVAMEGPSHDPQLMAVKLSPRANWNSWQILGSMNPEEAMEKYIALVSDKFPGWMDTHPSVDGKISSDKDENSTLSDTAVNTPLTEPLACTSERSGEERAMGTGDFVGRSSSVNKDEE